MAPPRRPGIVIEENDYEVYAYTVSSSGRRVRLDVTDVRGFCRPPPQQITDRPTTTSAEVLRNAVNRHRNLEHLLAPIKSAEDLKSYIKTTPPTDNPLDHLSSSARKHFLASLRFSEKGLTSYRYSALQGLSATEIYRILSLLGVQTTTPLIKSARILDETDAVIMQSSNVVCRGICPPLGGDGGGGNGGGGGGSGDHKGYKCVGPGTCERADGYICTDNC